MKKFLALLLALVMTMSLVTVGASAKTAFTDDKDITEVEAVEVLSAMGIIDGYKDGSFKPLAKLTRGAGAKFVAYLMLGQKNADGLKATGTLFEDVAADYAQAPYIEWCAKMGIVDGYGNGNFGPKNDLTQAAFGKMLLTALGYDSAKEGYTGAGWQKAVYADGLKAGVYGDDGEIFAVCNRETAAKMALGALTATMVEYDNNDKLQNVVKNWQTVELWETYKNLTYQPDVDNWGRPGHTWIYGKDADFEKFYVDEPVLSFTVATKNCDIYDALDADKDDVLDVYVNGDNSGSNYTVADDSDKDLGAQGQLVEIYEVEEPVLGAFGRYTTVDTYRVVVVDTYLAKVTDVEELEYDKNGHLEEEAELTFEYYSVDEDGDPEDPIEVTLKSDEANFDYAKKDMILVNVNAADDEDSVIVGLADSKNGVQTTIFKNSDQHEIEDKVYDDACQFALDEAGNDGSVKYTWFFDQYGNVIGAKAIKETYNYAVISYIEMVEQVKKDDYVVADLVFMDGSKKEDVKIASINDVDANDIEDIYTDWDDNGAWVAADLYRVNTNKDGEYVLELAEGIADVADEFASGTATATIENKNPNVDGGAGVKIDNATMFLVRGGDKFKKYTFEAVTGMKNVKDYTDVVIDWVDDDDDGYAEYVYIIGDADETTTYSYVMLKNQNYSSTLKTDEAGVKYATFKGAVDLEGKAVELKFEADDNGNTGIEAIAADDLKNEMVLVKVVGDYVETFEAVDNNAAYVALWAEADDAKDGFDWVWAVDNNNGDVDYDGDHDVLDVGGFDWDFNVEDAVVLTENYDKKTASYLDGRYALVDRDGNYKDIYVVAKSETSHIAKNVVITEAELAGNEYPDPVYTVTLKLAEGVTGWDLPEEVTQEIDTTNSFTLTEVLSSGQWPETAQQTVNYTIFYEDDTAPVTGTVSATPTPVNNWNLFAGYKLTLNFNGLADENCTIVITGFTSSDAKTLNNNYFNADSVKYWAADGCYIPANKLDLDMAGDPAQNRIFKFTAVGGGDKAYTLNIENNNGIDVYTETANFSDNGGHFFYVTLVAGTNGNNAGTGSWKAAAADPGTYTWSVTCGTTVLVDGSFVVAGN